MYLGAHGSCFLPFMGYGVLDGAEILGPESCPPGHAVLWPPLGATMEWWGALLPGRSPQSLRPSQAGAPPLPFPLLQDPLPPPSLCRMPCHLFSAPRFLVQKSFNFRLLCSLHPPSSPPPPKSFRQSDTKPGDLLTIRKYVERQTHVLLQ